ncbi:bifunctional enzyme ispD/ispF [Carbonactinospora thermoautotrophica]|nr:bifunctional enzyme ispD/ispF [Carbonactinospora thermoautotrophica]
MGGVDKAALGLGGRSLLARVTDAVRDARQVVLVGPEQPGVRVDVVTREDPPGSGPVAGIEAALPYVTAPVTVVLAADLPFLGWNQVRRLREALERGPEVALAVDDRGRDQLLLAAWRTAALRSRVEALGDLTGVAVRRLLTGVEVDRLALERAPDGPPPWFDCDTEQDLRAAERWT